jgi:hypothetical protein
MKLSDAIIALACKSLISSSKSNVFAIDQQLYCEMLVITLITSLNILLATRPQGLSSIVPLRTKGLHASRAPL